MSAATRAYITSNRGETMQALRHRALCFVEEVLPDADERAQVLVAQKIVEAVWPAILAARGRTVAHG